MRRQCVPGPLFPLPPIKKRGPGDEAIHRRVMVTVSRFHSSDQLGTNELSQVLLSYSRQVAFGLMYLANKKYVHRDIAARNILVNDDHF